MRKLLLCFFVMCIFSLSLIAQVLDQTIATVSYSSGSFKKTQPVLLSQIKSLIQMTEKQMGQVTTLDMRKQLVEKKILETLFLQICEAEKIIVSDTEISQAISYSAGGATEAQLKEYYKANGVAYESIRETVKIQLLQKKYVELKFGEKLKAIPKPTEDEILKKYDVNRASLIRPDTVRVAMIMVEKKGSIDDSKAKEIINKLYQQAKGNIDEFNKLIYTKSNDYSVDADFLISKKPETLQSLGQTAYDAIFSAKEKEISQVTPISGKVSGYVIFVVKDFYKQTQLGLSDSLVPGGTTSIHDEIASSIYNEKLMALASKMFDEIMANAKINAVKYLVTPENLAKLLTW